jgi:hypothetical protein
MEGEFNKSSGARYETALSTDVIAKGIKLDAVYINMQPVDVKEKFVKAFGHLWAQVAYICMTNGMVWQKVRADKNKDRFKKRQNNANDNQLMIRIDDQALSIQDLNKWLEHEKVDQNQVGRYMGRTITKIMFDGKENYELGKKLIKFWSNACTHGGDFTNLTQYMCMPGMTQFSVDHRPEVLRLWLMGSILSLAANNTKSFGDNCRIRVNKHLRSAVGAGKVKQTNEIIEQTGSILAINNASKYWLPQRMRFAIVMILCGVVRTDGKWDDKAVSTNAVYAHFSTNLWDAFAIDAPSELMKEWNTFPIEAQSKLIASLDSKPVKLDTFFIEDPQTEEHVKTGNDTLKLEAILFEDKEKKTDVKIKSTIKPVIKKDEKEKTGETKTPEMFF